MTLEWHTDPAAGSWLAADIRDFACNVDSVVGNGFDAYARIFHPIEGAVDRRWTELARRNNRIAHASMQYRAIATPAGSNPPIEAADDMRVGSLPKAELAALVDVLRSVTDAEALCWFAVWEGFGQLHGGSAHQLLTFDGEVHRMPGIVPTDVLAGPRLELPHRRYLMLRGCLGDTVDLYGLLGDQSANLWWPEDRAWLVATEIDFGCTYVGGSHELVERIVASPELEAYRAKVTDGVTYDSDLLNEPPAQA